MMSLISLVKSSNKKYDNISYLTIIHANLYILFLLIYFNITMSKKLANEKKQQNVIQASGL